MAAARSYDAVSMALHWATALLVLGQFPLGLVMVRLTDPLAAFPAYQLHKSLGLTVLGLTLIRLAWRLAHPGPPPPAGMPQRERLAARAAHVALHALLLAVPLAGWVVASASPLGLPVPFFGLAELPHLVAPDRALEERAARLHGLLAWAMIGLVGLHVLAALRHQIVLKDGLLLRMVPARSGR